MKAKKTTNKELIKECESMLKAASEDYNHYKEKKIILKLLEIYDIKYNSYEELLKKREDIGNLLRSITGSELYKAVYDELNKQYNIIKIEQQDVKTYTSLTDDKNKKVKLLHEIEAENNSEAFTGVIKRLIESENRRKAKAEAERKRHEEEILKHRLLEEQKKKEEMIKRQKEIEEKRKKEIEERTKKLLEEKQKTPIITPREPIIEKETYSPFHDVTESLIEEVIEEQPTNKESQPKELIEEIPETEDYSFFNRLVDEIKIDDDEDLSSKSDQDNLFFSIKEESLQDPPTTDITLEETKPELPINDSNPNSIPVIKNHNLIPKKIKEELVQEEPKKQEEIKDLEDFSVEDIIFPDMP